MQWDRLFFLNSILLGAGLAMDAFSLSLVNGLNEPRMKPGKMCIVAGTYAFFQAVMPLTGWILVHTLLQMFQVFEHFIPWIALGLLLYIGGEMIFHAVHKKNKNEERITEHSGAPVGGFALLLQGIATSIDALSVGFTIADYGIWMALVCALLISAVTFLICMSGLMIGRGFGTKIAGKAEILGGIILLVIGLEIWITGIF